MKKKAFIILFLALVLLGATALTEFLFYRQDEKSWVQHFENRLHRQEQIADDILHSFRDSVDIEEQEWKDDLIFVGFRKGRIFFWTNESIGYDDLYRHLTEKGNFVKIGNSYYEVRRKKYKDTDYFALLRILDMYPYTSKYVKNKYGDFLKIPEENLSQITISTVPSEQANLVKDKDGNGLFFC